MGEHEDDYTIEEILALEATVKAKKLAEIETSELRKSIQAEFTGMLQYDSNKSDHEVLNSSAPTIDDTEIYCSVDELKDRIAKSKISRTPQFQLPQKHTVACFDFTKTNDRNIEVIVIIFNIYKTLGRSLTEILFEKFHLSINLFYCKSILRITPFASHETHSLGIKR
jgi:hypothetical protein